MVFQETCSLSIAIFFWQFCQVQFLFVCRCTTEHGVLLQGQRCLDAITGGEIVYWGKRTIKCI